MHEPSTFDYVIIGAGSAGCLLANRLTADRRTRVLLLEAGGQDDWIWFHIPIGYVFSIFNPRADWCYRTEPEPALAGRSIPYPRGKVVGGSSAINGMIYMRGAAADFDQWRQLGLSGWGWDAVLPYFKAHEDFFGGADEAHGAGGELRVDPPRVGWPVLDAVKRAAVEAGIKPTADFNRGDIEGIGPLHVNQRRGVRFQAAKAFLRPALIRPNLTLETGVLAERIRFEGGRAVGVDYRVDGTRHAANARAEVILAAGSTGSPQLLMLSGIGPAAHLRDLGIEVQLDRPGVGANLHDHMQVPLRFTVEGLATLNERYDSPLHKALMAVEPGDDGADDDASLLAAAAGVGNTVFHPVGTCKMGRPTDAMAVVDERLRLIGVGGVRVIDASIMPEITSGNTNAPTMMIAEKGAAMVLEDAR